MANERDVPVRRIGPVTVAAIDRTTAMRIVQARIARRAPAMIAFCNAHSVNLARRDPAFVSALSGALVLNDGIGVDLASRLLHGAPFPCNLNGTDFTPAVLAAIPGPLRIFLLGSPPGVAERAAQALQAQFPRHEIVGMRDGFFDAAENGAVADAVAATRPDLVLVGMGQPRQELWASAHLDRIGATVLCIGAYLDFAAGRVSRAPSWMQRMRFEWLYRLALEPRRMARRYVTGNARFLIDILRDRTNGEARQRG